MKGLSIQQPYADLIMMGLKTIETRTWITNLRGRFLICAGKKINAAALRRYPRPIMPLGAIVGSADLVYVIQFVREEQFRRYRPDHMIHGNWVKYGFVLANVHRFEKPILYRGMPGFFDVPEYERWEELYDLH